MFDRAAIDAALRAHKRVVRVVVCTHQGSSPREAGASMLVWHDGQSGTIGGGALEYDATEKARAMLAGGTSHIERMALGPTLGQCCGGAVTLAYEPLDAAVLAAVPDTGLYIRRVARDGAEEMPLPIRRAQKQARGEGVVGTRFLQGWLAEPVAPPRRALWVWGAGHVGRAIVATIAPLPDVAITWIDTGPARFPTDIPQGVTVLYADNPAPLATQATQDAEHLVLTYSHPLDLDLCHTILGHGFARLGLIGSHSKWVRFRNRLQAAGHDPALVGRIQCPIGDPSVGKHPQAIAISVAAAFLQQPKSALFRENAL